VAAKAAPATAEAFPTFGHGLKYLRRRARLTQRELGLAVGYSEAQICRLEQNQRLPDPITLAALFVPALGLERDQVLAARLLELATEARGQRRADSGRGSPELDAIPASPRHAVPRRKLFAELRERLASDRAVIILGLAGMGKTTLAADLGRMHRPEPVCWLTLTSGVATSWEAVLRRLARLLVREGCAEAASLFESGQDESKPATLERQLELLGEALAAQPPLVCMDNAHLVRDDEMVMTVIRYLVEATPVRLLLTSREQLPLPGVGVFRLAGLEPGEARTLVAQLDQSLPAELVERLIARTAGSPMLLRLSLGQLRTAAEPAGLIEHLETQPEIADYLLDTTLRQLGEPAAALLALLGVLRQPVDLHDETLVELYQASEGPCDLLAALAELQRHQLVDHPSTALLHPLVRDQVYARLIGDVARRRRLHRLAADWLEQARGDVLEAAWHFGQAGDLPQAAEVLAGQGRALFRRGQALSAADLAGALLTRAGRRPGPARQLHLLRGDLLMNTVRAGEAEAAYREALVLSRTAPLRAQVAWRLAESQLQRGQVAEALELCRRSAADLAPTDTLLLAQLAASEGRAYLMLSQYDDAIGAGERAAALAGQLRTVVPREAAEVRARALATLGIVARLRRQPEAFASLRRAVTAAREAGLHELANRCLYNIGALRFELGHLEAALEVFDEVLAEMQAVGDSYGVARVLHAVAQVQRCGGDLEAALATLDRACTMKRELGDVLGLASSENSRAYLLMSLGRVAEARTLVEWILAETADMGEQWVRGHFLDTLGMVLLVAGEVDKAQATLREALALPGRADPHSRAEIEVHLALALLIQGEVELAEQVMKNGVPAEFGAEIELQFHFLGAALALARSDRKAVRNAARAMAERVAATGYTVYAPVAAALAAAADDPPPLTALPQMLLLVR
jgi:ATP/maltotriose-dependent transcriptional regulator MalT/DNA-binding XRE family transcriptional regulator